MYAIVQTGGKQYKAAVGDVISVEKLDAEVGAEVTFDVLLVADGDNVTVGTPVVEGVKATGKVVEHGKGKKVIVFKYKPTAIVSLSPRLRSRPSPKGMVRVTVIREQGTPVGFELTGHADQGAYGEDIVCAGISAITETALLGITDILKLDAAWTREDGHLRCELSRDIAGEDLEKAAIVFNTMIAGLTSLRQAYPKSLKFSYREV